MTGKLAAPRGAHADLATFLTAMRRPMHGVTRELLLSQIAGAFGRSECRECRVRPRCRGFIAALATAAFVATWLCVDVAWAEDTSAIEAGASRRSSLIGARRRFVSARLSMAPSLVWLSPVFTSSASMLPAILRDTGPTAMTSGMVAARPRPEITTGTLNSLTFSNSRSFNSSRTFWPVTSSSLASNRSSGLSRTAEISAIPKNALAASSKPPATPVNAPMVVRIV